MFHKLLFTACLIMTAAFGVRPVSAQMDFWGQIDLAAVRGYEAPYWNRQIRGDDTFNDVRLRLFAQHWMTDRIGVFAELLFDLKAAARVNGAYVVVNELLGEEWLGARVGLAPTSIGTYGMRSSYFNQSGLVAIPMQRGWRTTMDNGGRATPEDFMRRKADNVRKMPVLYDACWNIMWELLGTVGKLSYAIGATSGSLSNPMGPLSEPGLQWIGRLGYTPALGVTVGVSGAQGPYIGDYKGPAADILGPAIENPDEYDQRYLGVDLELSRDRYELFGEAYTNSYELENVQERVAVRGAYLEGRRWISPSVFLAARGEVMDFGGITVPGTSGLQDWDDDVRRVEAAVGYRLTRESILRLGWQHTAFVQGNDETQNVLIAHISAVF